MLARKIILFSLLFVLVIGLASGANSGQVNSSLSRGLTYLQNSEPEIWNATDYMALYYLKKEFNLTIPTPLIDTIRTKRTFSQTEYPYTYSLFEPVQQPVGGIELGLITPALVSRITNCQPFPSSELNTMALQTNTPTSKYVASHSVLMLNLIKNTYLNCGLGTTATTAGNLVPTAIQGLMLNHPTGQTFWDWDAYLEQECARRLSTGIQDPMIVDELILLQDKNILEPRTYGGWYQYGRRLNEPMVHYDENGENPFVYYSELPSAHTTLFAMCILGKTVNAK